MSAPTWRAFWARAVQHCADNDLPIPSEAELRAEYIERSKQLAGLKAWTETNGDAS